MIHLGSLIGTPFYPFLSLSEPDLSGALHLQQRLGPLHLTLFTVCAITTLDTLTAVAAIGPSALFWWPVILVGFVLPYGLVTSELATAWPEDGGISYWIRRAFGQSWGVRAC